MQLVSEEMLPVAREVAWQALNDPEILRTCIPGCESIAAQGEGQYEVEMMASIGPVKAKFKGKMRLTDIQPPESYIIQFVGQGGAAGHAKGSARVRLDVVGEAATRLVYTVDAQVGGKIAQIGSRLVDMAAQKMAADFFAAFHARFLDQDIKTTTTPVAARANDSHEPSEGNVTAAPLDRRPALGGWFKKILQR